MSVLSDDTDVLLIIPPDFFLIPSDSEEDETTRKRAPESLIVSDLITQVNDLEGRICLIEHRCLNESAMTGNTRQLRRYGSADALDSTVRSCFNTRSLQATPNKTGSSPWKQELSPSRRTSFPLEMRENILTSTEYVSRKDKDENLLREINHFFRHKESEGTALLTKPESAQLSTHTFNLNRVNDLLKKLDETQKEMEDKVKLKQIAEAEAEDSLTSDKARSERLSQEQLKNAKRALNFDEREEAGNSVEFRSGEEPCMTGKESDGGEKKLEPDLTNLLSLSNLWGSSGSAFGKAEDELALRQRLQEENCRRQHCERLVQQLQVKLLEEEEKIAVAIKVDQEKDQAIARLAEGWTKLVGHWRELEIQRNNMAKKLQSDREKFKTETSAAYQTVKRYEVELSKALDLAHGYKEKCEASEREKKTLLGNAKKEIEAMKAELKATSEKLKAEESRREKLEKLLETKEELANQGKAKLSEIQNQMRESKRTLKELQTELESSKAEKEKLGEKLREERSKSSASEQSKKSLQHQLDESKKREKVLKEDFKALTEQMEKVKLELKEFYQGQVESIVQEKLKEFQEQLSGAEKALQAEIELREKTVTEMAVKQVQQIVEKHLIEVNLLEEKHRDECELWKMELSQKEEKIKELQKKLEQYSSNKSLIAQKLHSVMEAQWQEALKIITSSSPQQIKSPPSSARSEGKPVTRQNTFTLNSGWGDGQDKSMTSSSGTPFCQDGLVTFREEPKEPLTYRINETPQKMPSDNLKKYIKTLLEKAPGHPVETESLSNVEPLMDDSSSIRWQHILSEISSSQFNGDVSKYSESAKASKDGKPPWK